MIFSYNTFEKRRRNYASSFFFIIYRRATSREKLTNRGLLLICVETTFQDIHTQNKQTAPCLIERAHRLLLSVKTSQNILINCVKLLDNIIIIWYNKGTKTKRGIYMKNDYTIIEKAYEVLKPNEKRWLMDADYRRKYEYVKEAIEETPNYTDETVEYIAIRARFLVDAHNRIYRDNVTL